MTPGRLAKLKAMGAREIAQRAAYAAYTGVERRAHARGRLALPGRVRTGLVPPIARAGDWLDVLAERGATRRFFSWEESPEEIRQLIRTQYEPELTRAREVAAAVARHEIGFFGETFQFGSEINWHADPVSGAQWPRRYHRDVPTGLEAGCGDVKYVWELNRHQFFVDLAKIAFIDRSRAHAEAVHALLGSWQSSVPYATGAPWACALEPAFRAWSWMWSYRLLSAAGMLDANAHLQWLTGLYDHARFLHRHLEYHASPYNHLIGEASALFALGLLLPEFREAPAWVSRGRDVLESTVEAQFHADGGSVEQSTFYHHATLGFYLLSVTLGRRHGIELSPRVHRFVERGIEFSMLLMQPDGRVPRIGGADDGKPIRLEHLPFWDFRPYQAIGAFLFSRPDFKFAAGRFWEDALWVLGCEGAEAFDRLAGREPATSAALPASGYYVVRSDWSATGDYLCFDCGEQAAGLRRDDVPSAAHGHADCLSVIAALGGQPVLVDPGFYCYNGPPEWEVYFRKTVAHSTVMIDGLDQARHIAKMAWTHTYTPHFEGAAPDGSGWARGSHDGYAKVGQGLVHRRAVWLRPGGYIVIYDEITGEPGHVARANYQFAPGSLNEQAGNRALFADRFEVAWGCSVPVTVSVIQDGESPSGGWIAASLGVRERAPRLVLEFPVAAARVALLTILADRTRGADERQPRVFFCPIDAEEDSVVGGWIRGATWEDHLVATPGDRTIEWAGMETDASLALVRVGPDGAGESWRIGGTHVRIREQEAVRPGQREHAPAYSRN